MSRLWGINFIFECGARLELKLAIPTGCTFFHRAFDSYEYDGDGEDDRRLKFIAMACLSLAAKVEEEERPLKSIVTCGFAVLDQHKGDMDVLSNSAAKQYVSSLIDAEMIVLRALGFMLHCENPHRYIMQFCRTLVKHERQDQVDLRLLFSVTHVACAFANDMLRVNHTPVILEADICLFAAACINAAIAVVVGKEIKEKDHSVLFVSNWEDIVGVDRHAVDKMTCEILDSHTLHEE